MKPRSILRGQMAWVLGALAFGAGLLLIAVYGVTRAEVDEILDASLRQTALLLADRNLSTEPASSQADDDLGESQLVVLGRRPDGTLLFSSQPQRRLDLALTPGASLQRADGEAWHVYTVVQPQRVIQVAQPDAVRSGSAAELAAQMLLPIGAVVVLVALLVLAALRRGLGPLLATNTELARLGADRLVPLRLDGVPLELAALVQTLNALLARLAEALQTQRRFLADAAHELRSPLTALRLQAQVLAGSREPDERAQAAAELAAGIDRASHLVRQLLQLSRAQAELDAPGSAASRQAVPLGALARTVVGRWAAQAEHQAIDLGVELRCDAEVSGDTAQLEVLLGNLVENALQHTPARGVVDVVVDRLGGKPALVVRDTGCGIAAHERERVFDRFYRGEGAAKRAEGGSGLGLAIVRAVADAHHARVSLHDRPGGPGLEVRVCFADQAPDGRVDAPPPSR